jgi:hypothetical protein
MTGEQLMLNQYTGKSHRKRVLLTGMSLALAGACWAAPVAAAGPLEDGRLAIIHANQSTIIDSQENPRAGLLKQLSDAGVLVIGRYLSRCREDEKGDSRWTKQIIHGGKTQTEEADAILNAGFRLISVYQYRSGDASSNHKDGPTKFTRGLGQDPEGRCEITEASQQIKVSQSPADEGKLDSQAAVKQAHVISQPPNTVIYFAVDYNFDKRNEAEKQGLLEYFRQVKTELQKPVNGYLVGAYGDGDALELLLGKNDRGERLIDFAWISPSRSYSGNSAFFNEAPWHLAHAQPENTIGLTNLGGCFEYEYDGDIQNNSDEREYVGAWNRSGRYSVPKARTATIFTQRRFVCKIDGVAPGARQRTCQGPATNLPCTIQSCFAWFVRMEPSALGNPAGDVKIDFYDYGRFDGRARLTSLTRSLAKKPLWWNDPDRPKQNCTCFGSDPQKPCP